MKNKYRRGKHRNLCAGLTSVVIEVLSTRARRSMMRSLNRSLKHPSGVYPPVVGPSDTNGVRVWRDKVPQQK